MSSNPGPSQGVQSAEVALTLLSHMAAAGGLHSVSELGRQLGMSRAKVHRYLVSLLRSGYVEQDAASARYRLGVQALQTGLSALAEVDFVGFAAARLPELASLTGHTVFTTVWGQHGATIVQWRESAHPVTVNVRVGSVLPLLHSATGRVYAAWLPEHQVLPLALAEWEEHRTLGNSVPGMDAGLSSSNDVTAYLREDWGRTRARGYATVQGHFLAGVNSAAVPVLDAYGELAGAITSLGLNKTFSLDPKGGPIASLVETSTRLSTRLGWKGK